MRFPQESCVLGGSWPRHLDLWFMTCQRQTRAPRLWIKLFDSSAHGYTKPALSQLLHKSLWNPRMVFVNSAAKRTEPVCQMWPRVMGRWESPQQVPKRNLSFSLALKKRACACQGFISKRWLIFLLFSSPPRPPKKLAWGRPGWSDQSPLHSSK